ncbi:MAG: ABC transporter permease [Lachnospiraceae bacterium]|nr:ABC transporter permease [Lachnospiraceae bacterium]
MRKKVWYSVVSFIVLLAVWQIAVMVGNFPNVLFPSPASAWKSFWELCMVGLPGSTSRVILGVHILVSLKRFLIGYISSVVTAVVAGLLLGWFPKVFAYINPVIQIIRPIAPVAWMPFIVLWFGIGDAPAVVIIFLAGFFPVLLSTVAAVEHMDPVYLKVARNFGLSQMQTIRKVVFPAVFPQIMNSLRLALGTAWIFLVSGEMVGAQSGLGFLIIDTKNCLRSDALLATMLTIGVIGLLLDLGIRKLEKLVA